MSLTNSLQKFATTLLLGSTLIGQTAVAAPHSVDTQYGTLSIEEVPQRIVTLYEGALDAAVAVGADPLGAVITRGGQGVAPYIQDRTPDIKIVGTTRETNLEAVIALAPDLILAPPALSQEQYLLLSSVAPTIVPDVDPFGPDSWQQQSLVYARAMGKETEMTAILGQITAEIDELKAELAPTLAAAGHQAILTRWMPQGAMVMSPDFFTGRLLQAVGFELTDAGLIKPGRPHSSPLSQEKLELIDQDWLFISTLNTDGEQALDAAKTSPAFARLAVVEQSRAFPVDGTLWSSATGPLAARELLQQLEALVLDQPE